MQIFLQNVRGKNFQKLSKTVSHALRHEPGLYGLILDEEGWVSIEEMMQAFHNTGRWYNLSLADIEEMQATSPKKRFEINNGKIRALYGHSLPDRIKKEPAMPPPFLFHGTPKNAVNLILNEGLRSMDRQYVHLSADEKTAFEVGSRRTSAPVILKIDTVAASNAGINFYHGNQSVWLSDEIPPYFISISRNT